MAVLTLNRKLKFQDKMSCPRMERQENPERNRQNLGTKGDGVINCLEHITSNYNKSLMSESRVG